jgi:hypothetical protein
LIKALSGADLDLAAGPASENPSSKLSKYLLEEASKQLDDLLSTKDKAKQKKQLARFRSFLSCFANRSDKKTVDFLAACFERRDEIDTLKGDVSGADVNRKVASTLILTGSKPAMKKIVDAHESLDAALIDCAFLAAIQTRTPKEVYDLFSPYLRVKTGLKKKRRDPASEKRESVRDLLSTVACCHRRDYYVHDPDFELGRSMAELIGEATLDPRWLDAAIEAKDLELVQALFRPRHKATNEFLSKTLDAMLKKKGIDPYLSNVLETMIRAEHPRVTEHFCEGLKKVAGGRRQYYFAYWLGRLVPQLPKKAAPEIEALLPTLPEWMVDGLAPHVDTLKMSS